MVVSQKQVNGKVREPKPHTPLLGKSEEYRSSIEQKRKPGYAALTVMERHLTSHTFFVDRHYTITDISLFAYTHVAHESEFNLTPFSAIQAWLERVKAQSKHITITQQC